MRFALLVFSAAVALQSICQNSIAGSQSEPPENPRSGWYAGATLGLNRANDIDQEGWNRDTFCYPTDACFDLDPIPTISGYRWRYINEGASGHAFQVSIGRILDRKRVELAISQRKNGIDQIFQSVTNFDGMPMEDREGGTIDSNTRSSIDDLVVRSLSLHAYYDLPGGQRVISPYVGVGLGAAYVAMTGTHYSDNHTETSASGQVYDPPLSFYNGRQEGDLGDVVLIVNFHAGAEYPVGGRTMLGLNLTYSLTGGVDVRGEYEIHPMHSIDPDFSSHNSFAGARLWTLTLNARRLFGN
ncbi:MAG: P44/Msp2 family outer membrane protein [Gemmatimonadota bacterium]|nr:P44/Msp2 family outer membrane protein [Gemmatimonadota bacterium]